MRTRFDQFAKQLTGTGFAPGGTVRTDEEVSPDAGHIDIWFNPNEGASEALAPLGMLGRIGAAPCTLEPFHQTPDGAEVKDCICKHHHFRRLLSRRDPQQRLPVQWILSAGCPAAALAGLWFRPVAPEEGWGPGVYEGPPLTYTRLIVVAELPETRDTLLLRLMGAGRVLSRALAELRSLPMDTPERALALPLLVKLRIEVPADPAKRTQDDEEYIMSMDSTLETYIEQWKREGRDAGLAEGRDAGLREGLREALVGLYQDRFGPLPPDLSALIAKTHDAQRLLSWTKLCARGSAEDLAAAIRAPAE